MPNLWSAAVRILHRARVARGERAGSWRRRRPKGGDGDGEPRAATGSEASEPWLSWRALPGRTDPEARREAVLTSCRRAATEATLKEGDRGGAAAAAEEEDDDDDEDNNGRGEEGREGRGGGHEDKS